MDQRQGFTLVELLVVVAIVGILVGLLLPAVQSAREAVRKVSCKNNLHQVGVALHNYHGAHGVLPTGCIEWRSWHSPPDQKQIAWSALLLPFLDQQPLHESIDFGFPFDHAVNESAASAVLNFYLCPSTRRNSSHSHAGRGIIDYGGLYGERLVDLRADDGVFLYEQSIGFRDVLDGQSNTLAISEDVGGPDNEWINGRNVFLQSGGINDPNVWVGDNEIRSDHPNGAMALFVDGHVRFLSDSTDRVTLGGWITRDGNEISNYPM